MRVDGLARQAPRVFRENRIEGCLGKGSQLFAGRLFLQQRIRHAQLAFLVNGDNSQRDKVKNVEIKDKG